MPLLIWMLVSAVFGAGNGSPDAAFQAKRQSMVQEQIEKRGVKDPAVLSAMRRVPRHVFVPESLKTQAYTDQPLPIGSGQTISQPYIVAVMTELLRPAKSLRVLEIGTGSGYQCAILAETFGQVFSIEILPELAQVARERIKALGYRNVEIRTGDGYLGWPEGAPFDRILLTAAPPEVPEELIRQLARGGRMVAPVGRANSDQYLMLIEKDASGEVTRRVLQGVRFVPMVHSDSRP